MLIPLFGLQLILTIYRPEPTATWIKEYEYATFIITNSQVFYYAAMLHYHLLHNDCLNLYLQ